MNAAPALNEILDNIKSELSKIEKANVQAEIIKKQEIEFDVFVFYIRILQRDAPIK